MKKSIFSEDDILLIKRSKIPFAIYRYAEKRIVTVVVSGGFCELFNTENNDDLINHLDNDMYYGFHPEDTAAVEQAAFNFYTKNEPYDVVFRLKFGDKYRIIHSIGKRLNNDDDTLAVAWYTDEGEFNENAGKTKCVISDAYSKFLIENSAFQRVQYDVLTGLPSITYFFELAEHRYEVAVEKNKTPVILFFDLNGMKYFNHKYGFSEGDKLILAFSKLLIKYFTDTNCSRFGLDHFCVYTVAENLEERLYKLFDELENINDGKSLPARVGIFKTTGVKIGTSFACDMAKIACDSNKGFYVSHFTYFDESMYLHSKHRQYIIDNIDRAIKEKWIHVYYQPIVRASGGGVCDEEALSRWIDPERGLLPPDEFIPILEETNLIYKLDLYVLDQILEKILDQKKRGLFVVPTSVNLSRSDFESCDIVEEIRNRVQAAGVSPELITIEITESIIGKDYEFMKTQVERFHSLGFKVWMDDFGSGYSSPDVLQNFNFDLIKLDMKFMHNFNQNEKSKIILTHLIRMALSLGIETVCEGVETREQKEFLQNVGCTKLQGYYYGKAISYEDILEHYNKGTQIGFENPYESDYYATIGKVNVYDLSVVTSGESEIMNNYFNNLPIAILELDGDVLSFIRGNDSYKDFFEKFFGKLYVKGEGKLPEIKDGNGLSFMKAILNYKKSSGPVIVDDVLPDGSELHAYVRRLSENPVTGVIAFVVVVLGIES